MSELNYEREASREELQTTIDKLRAMCKALEDEREAILCEARMMKKEFDQLQKLQGENAMLKECVIRMAFDRYCVH